VEEASAFDMVHILDSDPEPLHLRRMIHVAIVQAVGTPISQIDLWQSTDQQLQLTLVEDRHQILWHQCVEALQKRRDLTLQ
jgi:hypothetical protein